MDKETFRSDILSSFGATSSETEELLLYNQNTFDHSNTSNTRYQFPFEDEPFVSAWLQYSEEAESVGVFECLKQRLVQLSFPIKEGISKTDDYRSATRKGVSVVCMADATGVSLNKPDEMQLVIHQSPAGRIPLLIVGDRSDFITLTQALSMKNEPNPVPDSMGACMVAGFNNWDRIRRLKLQWEVHNPTSDWAEEFRRIIPRRELYQDRFIILSDGPYSNVSAGDIGLSDGEWKNKSLIIRREHECAHYLTKRIFGSMRNNIIDELIADYAGIVTACGHYRSDWFLRFVGLEDFPDYREGGRLQNYRGKPSLSDGAFKILQSLVKGGAENLERFDAEFGKGFRSIEKQPLTLIALTHLTLEELASDESCTLLVKAITNHLTPL